MAAGYALCWDWILPESDIAIAVALVYYTANGTYYCTNKCHRRTVPPKLHSNDCWDSQDLVATKLEKIRSLISWTSSSRQFELMEEQLPIMTQ